MSGCQLPQSELTYIPIDWYNLPGFQSDQVDKTLPAIQKSCCTKAANLSPETTSFCHIINQHPSITDTQLRLLLMAFFTPHKLSLKEQTTGKFTGYFEPLLQGSLKRYGPYQIPLYKLPTDPNINITIPRRKIMQGALDGKGLELIWVDDKVDAFFLEVQGSGRIALENGKTIRVGYAGKNNHGYTAIGKTLVDMGTMTVPEASMQNIKTWLRNNPDQANEILHTNQSYVFFKFIDGDGPIGSQGVALTPERSLAVDPRYIPLGSLLWVDIEHPDTTKSRLQHLAIAQDTGGAIKGGLRADYFWGFGKMAEHNAGHMNQSGEMYILLPRN